jgi:hypothetical protein
LEGGMEGKKERKSQQMSTNLDQNLVSPWAKLSLFIQIKL